MSLSSVAAQETDQIDLDNPESWTVEQVKTNPTQAFAKNMQKAVEASPDLLADPLRAEQFFSTSLDQVFSYSEYAIQYLKEYSLQHHSPQSAEAYRKIANYYLRSVSDWNVEDNQKIAMDYFTLEPTPINEESVKNVFVEFMREVHHAKVMIDGKITRFFPKGALQAEKNGLNVIALADMYNFVVVDGYVKPIPKEGGLSDAFTLTGIVGVDQHGNPQVFDALTGHPITVSFLRLSDGTINGQIIENGESIRLDKNGMIYGTATRFGSFAFAQPTYFVFDSKIGIPRFLSPHPDKPIEITNVYMATVSGQEEHLTTYITGGPFYTPFPETLFTVPSGQQAIFLQSNELPKDEQGNILPIEGISVAAFADALATTVIMNGPLTKDQNGVGISNTGIDIRGSGLQISLPASVVGAESLAPESGKYFSRGMVNLPEQEANKVKIIQSFLKSQGLYQCRINCEIDGKFGPNTEAAVAAWQNNYNAQHFLSPDETGYLSPKGMWGPQTREAVLRDYTFVIRPQGGGTTLTSGISTFQNGAISSSQNEIYSFAAANDVIVNIYTNSKSQEGTPSGTPSTTFTLIDGSIKLQGGEADSRNPFGIVIQPPTSSSANKPAIALQLSQGHIDVVPSSSPASPTSPTSSSLSEPVSNYVDSTTGNILVQLPQIQESKLAKQCTVSESRQCGLVGRLLINSAYQINGNNLLIDGERINAVLGYPESGNDLSGAAASILYRKLTDEGWTELSDAAELQPFDVLLAGKTPDSNIHAVVVLHYNSQTQELLVGDQWGTETRIQSYEEWQRNTPRNVNHRLRAPPDKIATVVREIFEEKGTEPPRIVLITSPSFGQ